MTKVESAPVTGITVITYDLTAQTPDKVSETYNISVEVSFDEGDNYTAIESSHLTGDVEEVSPGEGKQITWDGAAGFPKRYSEETKVRLTADPNFICGESTVTFTYNRSEVTYGTVEGAAGSCWLDRNLGASQVATSSTDADAYGDLFQWGRFAEGHQDRANTVHYDAGLASTSVPNAGNDWDGEFIPSDSPSDVQDWLSTQDANLWQGVDGGNNPCPPGWRVPTEDEWEAERASWVSKKCHWRLCLTS